MKCTIAIIAIIVLTQCKQLAPRNGWNKDWGPVVSHKNFPADCSLCHASGSWDELKADFKFDHLKETGYELVGAHEQASCLRCHNDRGPVSSFLADGCGGCHVDPHQSKLGTDCEKCHGEDNWLPSGLISKHSQTRFPLVGLHMLTPCENCHERASNGDYASAPVQCEICHAGDVTISTSFDHVAAGLTTDCQRCHSPNGWNSTFIEHNVLPLTGGHGGLACVDCHQNGNFGGLSADCQNCHLEDYNSADNHVASSFPMNCEECHNSNSWSDAQINGHSSFPLTSGHNIQNCSRCHTPGTFQGLSTDCYSCHQSNYIAAADHLASNYPTTCEDCHNIIDWSEAVLDHSSFPLSSGHSGLNCTDCHTGGTFIGLSSACYSCHQSNYSSAPDHQNIGISTTCENCHGTTNWNSSSFVHNFPLQDDHNVSCATCHNAGSTALFDCLTCHPAGDANDDHDEVDNYIYASTACYNCHPNGDD